jgi:small nuclear ribonucleoprotein F
VWQFTLQLAARVYSYNISNFRNKIEILYYLLLTYVSCCQYPQSQLLVNPKPFLADLTGKTVRVRLKWGQEYQGKLTSSDAYMNLQLEETEEFIDGQFAGGLGEVLIRCNNVLYIKAADSKGAAPMET